MAEASSSNLGLKHQKSRNETNVDRISDLPDALLCHILSSLTTKQAIGTSILSSRWEFVWTCVPNLQFDEYCGDLRDEFIDRVMILHMRQCLKKFYLTLHKDRDPSRVNAWIRAVVLSNIEELHLVMGYKMKVKLPQILYHCCEKLVVLKLCRVEILNAFASFPSLKIFHLDFPYKLRGDSVEKILSGSPVLEDLSIYDVINDEEGFTVSIHSSSLKELKIYMDTLFTSFDVVAPKLEYLQLISSHGALNMRNLSSLVKAEIYISHCFADLQKQISNVKVLRVDPLCFLEEFFEPSNYNFVSYGNLTHLDVKPEGYGWLILPTIVKCSPKLEVLVVDMGSYCGEEDVSWSSPEDVPECMLLCLKMIELKHFVGECKEGTKMIKYFLKNSMVLEKMVIKSLCFKEKRKKTLVDRLLKFPKASSKCQIVIS